MAAKFLVDVFCLDAIRRMVAGRLSPDKIIGSDAGLARLSLLPLWEKVDRRDCAETDEGCSSGVRRRRSLEHASSVAFGDTFSHRGRREKPSAPRPISVHSVPAPC